MIQGHRQIACFDAFRVDLESGEVWRGGAPVHLAPQPTRLLLLLLAADGELVERETIRRALWGDGWVDWQNGLHQAIRQIRSALGDSAPQSRFVVTVPRRGYRFAAPISRRSVARAADSGAQEETGESASRRSIAAARPVTRAALYVVLSLILGLVAGHGEVRRIADNVPEGAADTLPRGGELEIDRKAQRLLEEGLYLLARRQAAEAASRFERSAELAPRWSRPWSALAEAELSRPGGERVATARRALERALSTNPEDAHAWRLLGQVRLWEEWDWQGARSALAEALRLAPEDPMSWQLLAALETVLGKETEAVFAARRAMLLDPVSTALQVDLGWTYYYFGRLEPALAECSRSLALDRSNPSARQCVLQALLALGREQQARSLVAATNVAGDPLRSFFERQLRALGSAPECASSAASTLPQLRLGDLAGAMQALIEGARAGRGWEVPYALRDPLLAPLRALPEFSRVTALLDLGSTSRN